MDRKYFSFLLIGFLLAGTMVACTTGETPPASVLTPPTIGQEITRETCPSIEARAGMEIAWTNLDNIDLILWLERRDENGELVDAGGTDLLQSGTTFSIVLTEPGRYTYFCSRDRSAFGTIIVRP